jgi:alkanesulfonate monooxygenase SsuD/methylene tetrahydromethanopterin reductase-like flavin-dependent oxidoreductase (luciferase family)
MPDYGHPRFGTFITLTDPAQQPVEVAVLAEELGFDLVTLEDHPDQPAFLDTWALLAWVATRTKRRACLRERAKSSPEAARRPR